MTPLKEVIRLLKAKKSLGQNFLTDPHILQRIVAHAGPFEGRTVIEVGPGPGGLTREIIKQPCSHVILVEQDKRCIPFLEELKDTFKGDFLLVSADALTLPLHTFGDPPRKIIANLPYNISVPLLLRWLKHIDHFESLTLMFQKEVALRILARSNTSSYGRLSIMTQWRAHAKKVFDLAPGAFFPPPKVTSTVLHFTPRFPREDVSWEALEKVTRATFTKRRKMLRSSLKELLGEPQAFLESLGINPERRAETLTVQEFCRLAAALEKKVN